MSGNNIKSAKSLLNDREEISRDGRSFLDQTFKKVLELYRDVEVKEKLKHIGEKVFYSNFFDITQLRICNYQLIQSKSKMLEQEMHYNKVSIDDHHKRLKAEKEASNLLNATIENVISKYKIFCEKADKHILKIQKYFRGHLLRLIIKMELMNSRIEKENELAIIRARAKSLLKKQTIVK